MMIDKDSVMNNLNKLLSETGFLTSEGKAEFEKALAPAVKDILSLATSENECNMLGSTLVQYVAEMISVRRSRIKETASKFDAMSDVEFEQYLKDKYGENYLFVSLTDEEMRRVPRLSKETIEKAIAEGLHASESASNNIPAPVDSGLRFK